MSDERKFVVGEDVQQPSPLTPSSANVVAHTTKRHTRHHVKRRSSGGRLHVAKLAPMARVIAHTDNEAVNIEVDRPVLRRSQSQRSLHRLDKKKTLNSFAMPSSAREPAAISPPRTPPLSTATKLPPTICLSHINPAAPVEQTFHAVANNLVIPSQPAFPVIHEAATSPSPTKSDHSRKQPLRSLFLNQEDNAPDSRSQQQFQHTNNVSYAATAQPSGINRTQQKLMLQRQQYLIDDENNLSHPRNMLRLTHELDRVGREYRCVKQYQDPMRDSLLRCLERRKRKRDLLSFRSASTSTLQTQDLAKHLPHMDQRHAAHRHHYLNAIAARHMHTSQSQQQPRPKTSSSTSSTSTLPFGLSALLDRVLGTMFRT